MNVKLFREKIELLETDNRYFEVFDINENDFRNINLFDNDIPEMSTIERRTIKVREIVYKGKLIRIAIENKLLNELIDDLLEENMRLNPDKYKNAKNKEIIKYKGMAFYRK